MALSKYDQLVVSIRCGNLRNATRLHSAGIRLPQKTRNDLLSRLFERSDDFNPFAVRWLHDRGARLSQDAMEGRLVEVVKRDDFHVAFSLEAMGAILSHDVKNKLLAEMVHPLNHSAVKWLEDRGAVLSQDVKDKLLADVVKRPVYVDHVSN